MEGNGKKHIKVVVIVKSGWSVRYLRYSEGTTGKWSTLGGERDGGVKTQEGKIQSLGLGRCCLWRFELN